MNTAQSDSFKALRAEAGQYRTTQSATDNDIVETWNLAAGRLLAKDIGMWFGGMFTILVGVPLLKETAATLAIYGGPVAAAALPQLILSGLVVAAAVVGARMACLGAYRFFKDSDAMRTTKEAEIAVQANILPTNPRILNQALDFIKMQGNKGEPLSALPEKFFVIGSSKTRRPMDQKLEM